VAKDDAKHVAEPGNPKNLKNLRNQGDIENKIHLWERWSQINIKGLNKYQLYF
jgi:hypothetical protein